MKISYLGLSERNCNKKNKQRYALIEGLSAEINIIAKFFDKEDIECDIYGNNSESELYITVVDKDDYEYIKSRYKEFKTTIKAK